MASLTTAQADQLLAGLVSFVSQFASADELAPGSPVAWGDSGAHGVVLEIDDDTAQVVVLEDAGGMWVSTGRVESVPIGDLMVVSDLVLGAVTPPDQPDEPDDEVDDPDTPVDPESGAPEMSRFAATGEPGEPSPAGLSAPYRAVLVVMGTPTGDGRFIERGALSWRDLPLTLMSQLRNPDGGGGHDAAEIAGLIEAIEIDGDNVYGILRFDLDSEVGRETLRLLEAKILRGISVDLDAVEGYWDDEIEDGEYENGPFVMTQGRIMGATVTPFPAFAEAIIEIEPVNDGSPVVASGGPTTARWVAPLTLTREPDAVVASGGAQVTTLFPYPTEPPREWFTAEPPAGPAYPFRVEPDGRCHGYAYRRMGDHISYLLDVVPHVVEEEYRFFHTGHALCADGTQVPVGRIYKGTVHPVKSLYAADARGFYDDTGMLAAAVRGRFVPGKGFWLAGAMAPEATGRDAQTLRISDISPDWRAAERGGKRVMLGILAVNQSALVVPDDQALVASGGASSDDAIVGVRVGDSAHRSLAARVDDLERQLGELRAAQLRARVNDPTVADVRRERLASRIRSFAS